MKNLNQAFLLAQYLEVLEDITKATEKGIETLQKNAETTSKIINQLINAEIKEDKEKEDTSLFIDSLYDYPITYKDTDKIMDQLADEVVDQIMEQMKDNPELFTNGIGRYSIALTLPEGLSEKDFDLNSLFDIVQEKLIKKAKKFNEEKRKRDEDDEFGFGSLLE